MEDELLSDDETLDTILDIKVIQRKKGYRFSIDALLLASFVLPLSESDTVMDIGTGSGIIPLVLAKRSRGTQFYGIEIQEGLFQLSERNVRLNGLDDRITVLKGDFRDILDGFEPGAFTVLVCNPPYRRKGAYRFSPDRERAIARYEAEWSMVELFRKGKRILKEGGRISIIYPVERLDEVVMLASAEGLKVRRMRFVHPDRDRDAELCLIEAGKGKGSLRVEPPIYLEDGIDHLFNEF